MNTANAGLAKLAQDVADELRSSAEQRVKPPPGVPERSLLWLALAPVWTHRMAAACGFPSAYIFGTSEATRVLDQIADSGLCAVVIGDAPESEGEVGNRKTERRYFMTDLIRQQVVGQVMRHRAQGIETIKRELATIGRRALNAADDGAPLLRSIQQWARLAALADNVPAMAELLTSECDRLLTHPSTEDGSPSGTVLAWIQAAEPLDDLLKGELTAALDRARRQLDLFHRRRDDDQRYLRHFQACAGQLSAINDLLNDDDAWALHFAGTGGTGKTMLMRYISSVLGPELGASTARIDFDYLSPDYPAERPGLLLAELAEELRLSAEGAAISLFSHFDDQVATLHEQRAGSDLRRADADAERISVDQVLHTFGLALAALPGPVILLIDTCEELAKVRPDGTSPEGVTRTFAILTELRRTVPGLKVIFAGRRPLARSGDGWEVSGESELPDRPYLRLCEVRGFSRDEALAYLDSEQVPDQLRDAILGQAQNRSQLDPYIWTDPTRVTARTTAYVPFELTGWAALTRHRDGASLTVADITAADADRYIELRIIRRIRYEPLKRALPAIGLLGRCDRALLFAALPDLPYFEKMFAELRQQEWITRRGIEFYEVDEGLRARLLAHYERTDPAAVEHCYTRLAEHLERRTIDDPLADLLPFHFDTAMRVLRCEPDRAARWWAKAEARFAAERQFDWARQLCELMLGPDGACAGAEPLRAGVLATQMACFTHTRPQADRTEGWAEVAGLLPDLPDEEMVRQLALRAGFGLIAAAPPGSAPPDLDQIFGRRLSPPLDEQIFASMLAALETVAEYAEQGSELWLAAVRTVGLEPNWPGLDGRLPPDLLYFLMSLCGRLALLNRNFTVGVPLLYQAATGSHAHYSADLAGSWLDWRQPDDLRARLALEFIRGAYPAHSGPAEVLGHLARRTSIGPPATIDDERLMSAEITLHAALAPVVPERVLGYSLQRALEYSSQDLRPTCNAHRAFPALPIVAAEQMAGEGYVDEALELLTTATRQWEQSRRELDLVTDAVRAQLRIIRRMRLRDEGLGTAGAELDRSRLVADRELLWSLDGLAGAKAMTNGQPAIELNVPDGEDEAAWRHARWRTLSPLAWSPEAIDQFGHAQLRRTSEDNFANMALRLDVLEVVVMKGALLPLTPDVLDTLLSDWWREHLDQPEQALRLRLRHAALDKREGRRATVPKDLIDRLGRRQAALIALDEGEMLGLRLPERARPILILAGDWFDQCHDYAGALIARTLTAVLTARHGRRAGAQFHVDVDAYLRFLSMLPSLADVQSIATSPNSAAMERLAPRGWRPWLVRLACYQAWSDPALRRAVNLRWFHDWIQRYYGTTKYGAPGLGSAAIEVPAELDGWLSTSPRDQGIMRPFVSGFRAGFAWLSPRQLGRVRDLHRRGKPYLWPAAQALMLMSVVLALVAYGVLTGLGVGGSRAWLGPAAYLGILGALSIIGPFLRGRFRHVRLGPGRATGATPILAAATISGDVRITLTPTGSPVSAALLLPPLDSPYELLPETRPAALTAELDRLGQLRDRSHLLQLQLPLEITGVCWEALFTPPLRIVRTLPDRRTRPSKPWRALKVAVSVTADTHQHAMAMNGWRQLNARRRFTHVANWAAAVYDRQHHGVDIVHIVATPIETASGLRLDLSRTAKPQVTSSPRGELMQPSDVIAQFPDVAFCVLQATPEERAVRTEAQRQQAAGLRQFAAEIFSLGVPVVVTIPPLPSTVASAVLSELSKAVTSRPRRFVAALTDALGRAAERLAQAPDLSPECALDLCLYADQGLAPIAKAAKGDSS